ncbi:MAG: nicotinate-nucleotide--dimethylbenzimidazole phosphoribosyltransferase, partial [Pirellulales bacterium]|nr:nicotinate-nucleotide--dimethylbenzimidazole phosphoribosyltransferase [Pirellulales bacterium]
GIGNTTAASCLIGSLCDSSRKLTPDELVGRGAGANEQQFARKKVVVNAAIQRVGQLGISSAKEVACQLGGLEIVALAGFYCEAAARRRTVLLDGLIATSAAVLAETLRPGTRHQLVAGHRSTEPAHKIALDQLQLTPVLELNMRLGEATGALAALPLLDLAAAFFNDMATLDELEL